MVLVAIDQQIAHDEHAAGGRTESRSYVDVSPAGRCDEVALAADAGDHSGVVDGARDRACGPRVRVTIHSGKRGGRLSNNAIERSIDASEYWFRR